MTSAGLVAVCTGLLIFFAAELGARWARSRKKRYLAWSGAAFAAAAAAAGFLGIAQANALAGSVLAEALVHFIFGVAGALVFGLVEIACSRDRDHGVR